MNIWNEIEIDGTPVLYSPDAASDEAEAIAAEHRTTVLELLKRRIDANHEVSALRHELKKFGGLMRERVQKSDGVWLTVDDVARLLCTTRKSLYCEIEKGESPLAKAATRLGRRIRFSKAGIDELMRTNGRLSSRRRSVLVPASGVPSRKGV